MQEGLHTGLQEYGSRAQTVSGQEPSQHAGCVESGATGAHHVGWRKRDASTTHIGPEVTCAGR
jgi:hypothetical protein